MQIRAVRDSDLPSILSITNREIAEGYAHFGTEPDTLADLTEFWTTLPPRYPWLVAEAEGSVVGFARATPWQDRGAYRWAVAVAVYVEPQHHGQGIGRLLYNRLFELIAECGFRTIIAGISLPNEASVRLHESMGMEKVAHFPSVGWKMERWIDVGYWVLVLGAGPPETEPDR